MFEWNSSYSNTWQWGPDNTIPFQTVGAMWSISTTNGECFESFVDHSDMWMVNGGGDQIIRWSPESFEWESSAFHIEEFTVVNHCDGPDGLLPFERIGAICRIVRPNMIQKLYFSEDGMSFAYQSVSEGIFSEVYELD